MAQQTAVNFLVSYMLENFHLTDEALEKFERAKQMEKEQIINAQMDMFHHLNNLPYGMEYLDKRDSAEEFCNTYGGQGSPDTTTSPNT